MKTKVTDNFQSRKIYLFFQKIKTPQYFRKKAVPMLSKRLFLMKILRGPKFHNSLIIKTINPIRHAHWHCLRRKN